MSIFNFYDTTNKNQRGQENISSTAKIAEETDKITRRELDEYIRQGKEIHDNQNRPSKKRDR